MKRTIDLFIFVALLLVIFVMLTTRGELELGPGRVEALLVVAACGYYRLWRSGQ